MNQSHASTGTSIMLMLGSVVLFATNALLIRGLALALPAIDGWMASLFRGAVGLVFLAALFGFGRGLELKRVFTHPLLILRGVIGAIGILIFYITVVQLGAGRAVVINLSYPIFGTLIAAVALRESPGWRAYAWMVAGLGGLAVFLGSDLGNGISGYDLLAVLGAVIAGAVVVLIRHLRRHQSSSTIYASQCVFAILLTAPMSGADSVTLPVAALGLLVLASILVALAQLAMTHAYRDLDVTRGSAIQMLLPILTSIGGVMWFNESFTSLELAGAALTLIATWRVLLQPPAPHPRPSTGSP